MRGLEGQALGPAYCRIRLPSVGQLIGIGDGTPNKDEGIGKVRAAGGAVGVDR